MAKTTLVKVGKEHAIRDVLREYDRLFAERFGRRPVILGGKDAATVKRLLAHFSGEELSQLLGKFFSSDDPWLQDKGYTIGVFASQVNRLVTAGSRATAPAWMNGLARFVERMEAERGH